MTAWARQGTKWHLVHAEHGDKPWAVQAEAAKLSAGKDRYTWFLEQGLGKTSLALNEFVECYNRGIVDVLLVICPNSFKTDWADAPAEWGVGHIRSGYWPRSGMPKNEKGPCLLSINFEAVRTGAYVLAENLLRSRRVMVVVDESLALGNPRSDTTKSVISLCHLATIVRLLNGTPLAKDVTNYFGQLKALDELRGMNPFSFRNRFAVMGGYMDRQVVGIKNEDQLYDILDRCSFRALKKDWRKDLPPKVYSTIKLAMTTKQRKHYREMLEEFFTDVRGLEVSAPIVLTKLDKLRQIASCLAMQDDKYEWLEKPSANPKVSATHDIIESGDTKTVVVHYYRPTGEMLLESLKKYNPAFIRGQMSPADVKEQKRRFNDDPDCRVIVTQQGAAYRGHTLIGGKGTNRANRMVFFENSFSYYQRSQIEDRTHRGAQDQECHYFDLVVSPVEQKILRALRGRKDVAAAIDDILTQMRLEL